MAAGFDLGSIFSTLDLDFSGFLKGIEQARSAITAIKHDFDDLAKSAQQAFDSMGRNAEAAAERMQTAFTNASRGAAQGAANAAAEASNAVIQSVAQTRATSAIIPFTYQGTPIGPYAPPALPSIQIPIGYLPPAPIEGEIVRPALPQAPPRMLPSGGSVGLLPPGGGTGIGGGGAFLPAGPVALLPQFAASLQAATTAGQAFQTWLNQLGPQLSNFASSVNSAFSNVLNTLFNFRAILTTLGIVEAVRLMATGISDIAAFDQQLARLRATLMSIPGGAAAANAQVEALAKTARTLALGSSFSATDILQQMQGATRAFGAPGAQQIATASVDLASAIGSDLPHAFDAVIEVLRSFNLTGADAQRVVDLLAAASKGAGLDFSLLSSALKSTGPELRALGIDMQTIVAVTAAFTREGMNASAAGNALRTGFANLLQQSAPVTSAMKQLGLTIEDINPAAVPLLTILQRINSAIELRGINQADAAFALFGRRAGSLMLALMQQLPFLQQMDQQLRNVAGTARAMAEVALNNLGDATIRLGHSITDLVYQLGGAMAPALTTTVNALTLFFQALGGTLDPTAKGATLAYDLAAALKGIGLVIAGYLVAQLANLVVAIGQVVIALIPLAAAWVATPLGLVLTLLTGAAIGYEVYKTQVDQAAASQQKQNALVKEATTLTLAQVTAHRQEYEAQIAANEAKMQAMILQERARAATTPLLGISGGTFMPTPEETTQGGPAVPVLSVDQLREIGRLRQANVILQQQLDRANAPTPAGQPVATDLLKTRTQLQEQLKLNEAKLREITSAGHANLELSKQQNTLELQKQEYLKGTVGYEQLKTQQENQQIAAERALLDQQIVAQARILDTGKLDAQHLEAVKQEIGSLTEKRDLLGQTDAEARKNITERIELLNKELQQPGVLTEAQREQHEGEIKSLQIKQQSLGVEQARVSVAGQYANRQAQITQLELQAQAAQVGREGELNLLKARNALEEAHLAPLHDAALLAETEGQHRLAELDKERDSLALDITAMQQKLVLEQQTNQEAARRLQTQIKQTSDKRDELAVQRDLLIEQTKQRVEAERYRQGSGVLSSAFGLADVQVGSQGEIRQIQGEERTRQMALHGESRAAINREELTNQQQGLANDAQRNLLRQQGAQADLAYARENNQETKQIGENLLRLKAEQDIIEAKRKVIDAKIADAPTTLGAAAVEASQNIIDAFLDGGQNLAKTMQDFGSKMVKESLNFFMGGSNWLGQLGLGLSESTQQLIKGAAGIAITAVSGLFKSTKADVTALGDQAKQNIESVEKTKGLIAGESTVAIQKLSENLAMGFRPTNEILLRLESLLRLIAAAETGQPVNDMQSGYAVTNQLYASELLGSARLS